MTSRTWVDNDTTKPLSAVRMNGIETDLQTALDGAANAQLNVSGLLLVARKTVSTATYTLLLSDQNMAVEFTAACTVTVPAAATTAFPDGWPVELRQVGAGAITVTYPAGVTITKLGTMVSAGAGASLYLVNRGTNQWWLNGDTTG